jgi:etoposide-induced 2.4 mRNA
MEPLKLFLKGVQDSLRIGTAIKEILGSFELTKRTV